jgi:hypothetical protein
MVKVFLLNILFQLNSKTYEHIYKNVFLHPYVNNSLMKFVHAFYAHPENASLIFSYVM